MFCLADTLVRASATEHWHAPEPSTRVGIPAQPRGLHLTVRHHDPCKVRPIGRVWLCARATWRRSSTTMPCSMTLALEMHGRRIQRLVCEPVGLPLTRRPRTSVADPAHGGRRGLGRGTQFVRSANVSPRLLRTNESPMRNIDLLTLRFEVSCSRRFARRRSMGAVAARLYLSGEPSPVWLGIRHPGGRVDMDITAAGETMVERPRRARWPWHRSTHAGGRGSRNRSSTG
jgi:hypothetical protein